MPNQYNSIYVSTPQIQQGFLPVRLQSLEHGFILPHDDDLLDGLDVLLGLDHSLVQVRNGQSQMLNIVPDS